MSKPKPKKSGTTKRTGPKKLRGDAARVERYRRLAVEASTSALGGDAHRRTLLRVIATLVEKLGGEVRLPFRLVAGAPDLGMHIEEKGTPRATMLLAVADRKAEPGIMAEDRVVVHSWSSVLGASEPDRTGLSWPGRVAAVDQGELLVVHLDQPHELQLERVIVPKGWARLEDPGASPEQVADLDAGIDAIVDVSTRVDTEKADGEEGEADPRG